MQLLPVTVNAPREPSELRLINLLFDIVATESEFKFIKPRFLNLIINYI